MVRGHALNAELKAHDRNQEFRVIASRASAVCVVSIRDGCRFNRAVLLNANAGIIFDSEETRVLLLFARNLDRCGGSCTRRLRIQLVMVVKRTEVRRRRSQSYSKVEDIIDVDALPTPKIIEDQLMSWWEK